MLETTAERPIAAPMNSETVPAKTVARPLAALESRSTAQVAPRRALPDLSAVLAEGIYEAFEDDAATTVDDPAEDSDVFVCRKSRPSDLEVAGELDAAATAAAQGVTLFVYGWHQVQPGPLSWVFPSVRSALDAVRTMRNAVEWCICSGEAWSDVDSARASGAVLVEQLA